MTELPKTSTHDIKWAKELSDVGQFSYVAICALSLLELFNNSEWDKDFQKSCLKTIIKHLHLPSQVESSAFALMAGQGSDNPDCFVDMFKSEEITEKVGSEAMIKDLITLAVKDGCYDSRMRVLIRHVCMYMRVEPDVMEDFEETLIESLTEDDHVMSEEERHEKESKARNRKIKRYALIGLATVGGGTLLGLTGGLAAPLLAAGVGTIVGGAGAAALGSVTGVAIIGSLFGVAGAGLGGYKMKKRVGDVEEFEFESLTNDPETDMHVTIGITGWLTDEDADFRTPWLNMKSSREQYALRFESKYMKNMGAAMDYLLGSAINMAANEALKYTVLSGILAAITWPTTLLTMSSVIDNPWSVCTQRTAAVGKLLAEVLLSRQQGKRPVTLIGFSLGARVIFYCLTELARRKKCEGIIEDVILLGAPVSGNAKDWMPFQRVVAGKIVNGYCRHDWLLRFLYRTASVQFSIAGLRPVKWQNRRMLNIDLSDVVNGHLDYKKKLDYILNVVGIRTRDRDYRIDEASEVEEDNDPEDQWMIIHKGPPIPSASVTPTADPETLRDESKIEKVEEESKDEKSEQEVADEVENDPVHEQKNSHVTEKLGDREESCLDCTDVPSDRFCENEFVEHSCTTDLVNVGHIKEDSTHSGMKGNDVEDKPAGEQPHNEECMPNKEEYPQHSIKEMQENGLHSIPSSELLENCSRNDGIRDCAQGGVGPDNKGEVSSESSEEIIFSSKMTSQEHKEPPDVSDCFIGVEKKMSEIVQGSNDIPVENKTLNSGGKDQGQVE